MGKKFVKTTFAILSFMMLLPTSVFAEDSGSAAIASDILSVAAFDADSSTPNASVSVSGNGQNSSSNATVDADVSNNSSIFLSS